MAEAIESSPRVAHRHRRRPDLLPYLLIAPAVVLVLLIMVYPTIYAVQLSTTDANLLRIAAAAPVGLGNYQKAFDDEIFTGSILRTVRWVVVVAATQLLVALPVALFLNREFPGRRFLRAAILIPWVVPGAVVAIIWKFMVDANYGVINDLLLRSGLIPAYVAWMSEPGSSFIVTAAAQVWSGFPFFAIALLAALQNVPAEIYESARIDGAGAWQRFRYVTLPLILPTIWLLLLLRTIWLSHAIDLLYFMTNGGPGYSNYTVALYSFLLTSNQLELGYPAAQSIMLSVVLLIAASIYIRLIERSHSGL